MSERDKIVEWLRMQSQHWFDIAGSDVESGERCEARGAVLASAAGQIERGEHLASEPA